MNTNKYELEEVIEHQGYTLEIYARGVMAYTVEIINSPGPERAFIGVRDAAVKLAQDYVDKWRKRAAGEERE